MVEDKIKEEVLYREGLAMGLEKGDTIVKRRMAQKVQFLAEDVATAHEPATAELKAWFEKNSSKFAMPSRYSFRHIYFSPDKRGTNAHEDAAQALARIAGQPENSTLSPSVADRFMFQDYYGDRTPSAIAKKFGPQFAVAIERLKPGSWQGPIESGFGWHLVFVDAVIPGRVPAFEEVESEVKTAWLGEQKAQAWQKAYQSLRSNYHGCFCQLLPTSRLQARHHILPKKRFPLPQAKGYERLAKVDRQENSKFEYRNSKQARMSETEESSKRYDLDERTLQFARDVRAFVKTVPRTVANDEDTRQLVRASGSVGANYIEANDSLSKKDFVMYIKISRKEAKESRYWLRLLDTAGRESSEETRGSLVREATELMNIFGAIVRKSE